MNLVSSTVARTICQHRLLAYYLLACAFAWWILYAQGYSPAVIIGFGPFLAAMIVLAPISLFGLVVVGVLVWRPMRRPRQNAVGGPAEKGMQEESIAAAPKPGGLIATRP